MTFIPPRDPAELFAEWYGDAHRSELNDPNAMALATVDSHGRPSLRMVLNKGEPKDPFIFFTNRHSRKGRELSANPNVALCFHWKGRRRQVRIEGGTETLEEGLSDRYFGTRPRSSQIGAWVSRQSQILKDRETFEAEFLAAEENFGSDPIARPPYWGGYRVVPVRFEFWQEREFRLHDRFVYDRGDPNGSWTLSRLYP